MKSLTLQLILILVAGLSFPPGIAQEQTYDSTSARNLRAEFDSCVVTARKHWAKGDKRLALKHSLSALNIAVKSDSIYDDLMTLRMVGQVYSDLQIMDSAEYYLSYAEPIADTVVHKESVRVYSLLGNIFTLTGRYGRGLMYHFLNLEKAQRIYPEFVDKIYQNIGVLYYKLGDSDRAITYTKKSLRMKSDAGMLGSGKDAAINLSLAYIQKGQSSEAKAYLDSLFLTCEQEDCGPDIRAHLNLAAGIMHHRTGNWLAAIPFLIESAQISEDAGYVRCHLDAIEALSQIYIDEDNLKEAEKYLVKGVDILRNHSSLAPDAADIYKGLANLSVKVGNYNLAYRYKEQSEKVVSHAEMRSQTVELMRVEGARIEREYKQRLEDRDRLLALQAGMVSKQRALNIVLGIAAVLAAALAFVLWRGLLRKKRIAHMLDRVVQSRTREIIERVRLASRAQEETAIRTSKARQELNLAFANIQQLCVLAATEETAAAVRDYLETVSDTAKQAANRMTLLLSPPAQDWDGINGQHFDTGNKPAP